MTHGSPIRLLLLFAIPLVLGVLLQQTYSVVDAMLVGRILGTDALAAVGAASSVEHLKTGFINGTCAGFGVPISRYFGAGDRGGLKRCVYHSLWLTAGLAVLLTALLAGGCGWILTALQVDASIKQAAYDYQFIIFLGVPAVLLYNQLAAILRAVGNSRGPFILLAVSTVLNGILDYLFVAVFGWGVKGAAWATVLSQIISGVSCLVYAWVKYDLLHFTKEDTGLSAAMFGELLHDGLPMGVNFSIMATGIVLMQSANNALGSLYTAAFTAGTRIKRFLLCSFDAWNTAVTVYVGQNMGAKNAPRIRKGVRDSFIAAMLFGIVMGFVLTFGGREMSFLFVSRADTAVADASAQYLFWCGVFCWELPFLHILRSAVQGMGHSSICLAGGVLEMLARAIVGFGLAGRFGYAAICAADPVCWCIADLYLIPCYFLVRRKVLPALEAEAAAEGAAEAGQV